MDPPAVHLGTRVGEWVSGCLVSRVRENGLDLAEILYEIINYFIGRGWLLATSTLIPLNLTAARCGCSCSSGSWSHWNNYSRI